MRRAAMAAGLAMLPVSATAAAQPPLTLDSRMFVERVTTDVNGRARRVLANGARAMPGDRVIVVLHWRNDSGTALRDAAVTRAVPRGVQLLAGHPGMQVSVDGGVRWGRLDRLWLPTPLGGVRRALPTDITHVRWTLPRAQAGESGQLSFRAALQ